MSKSSIVEVRDKKTFRVWCNQMHFSTKHVAGVLDVSRSNVYKYLNTDSGNDMRGPIVLLCNLISNLEGKERLAFIRDRLKNSGVTEHWPAELPISKE